MKNNRRLDVHLSSTNKHVYSTVGFGAHHHGAIRFKIGTPIKYGRLPYTARFYLVDEVHGKGGPSSNGEHRCSVVPQVQLRRETRGRRHFHLIQGHYHHLRE